MCCICYFVCKCAVNKYLTYDTLLSNCMLQFFPKNSIFQLEFSHAFNQQVDNLPPNLTHLSFGYKFNNCIDNLPSSLTHLTFGYYAEFDQPIDSLPKTLKFLSLGKYFNHTVDNLPSLTHLIFGTCFNQPIHNLPNTLTYLQFGEHFDQPTVPLPPTLKHLVVTKYFPSNLPHTLVTLRLYHESEVVNRLQTSDKLVVYIVKKIYSFK